MASEKRFENKIKKFLKDRGHWYVKFFANSYTRAGVPDLLACVNGQFVGIEIKAQNGKPSELQIHAVEEIRKADGYAFIIYPSAWEAFKNFILSLEVGQVEDPADHKIIWR